MRTRPTLPAGHGELLTQPDIAAWPSVVEQNRASAREWDFVVAGVPVQEMRALARGEALDAASLFSKRLGVPVRAALSPEEPIVATGHQPELCHPGVWVKGFLLQRIADEVGGTPVDLVVDSDGFDSVAVTAPCLTPEVTRCRQYLAVGSADTCYACAGVPTQREVSDFCTATAAVLDTLSAPSISRHFAEFCSALTSACADAANLAEALTFARRRYEASAGTDYLELPVTSLTRGGAFAHFIAHLALDALRFATEHNAELEEYRAMTGTRSAVQPFPNLGIDGEAVELPLWLLSAEGRRSVWARPTATGVSLTADGRSIAELPNDPRHAVAALLAAGVMIVPKALALTMFVRLFACDFFIHGVGGGRYDRVTDGVIRRVFGVEPPAFAVASMTLYLPLGGHVVTDDEVAAATERLNRLSHNPDALLGEVDFDSAEERERGTALAREKARLVAQIAAPGSDKKALGLRIRQVNAELADLLAPMQALLAGELEKLTAQRDASQVLTDRTYPYCLWDPSEIADKVR